MFPTNALTSQPNMKNSIFIAEKLLVVLRDGRTLIGFLRAIDQFGMLPIIQELQLI